MAAAILEGIRHPNQGEIGKGSQVVLLPEHLKNRSNPAAYAIILRLIREDQE